MAEIIIPFLALTATIFGTEKKEIKEKRDKRENYENMGKRRNSIPNVPQYESKFYPEKTKQNSYPINEYVNPNSATDKYYNADNFSKLADERAPTQTHVPPMESLTGETVKTNDFKHNNMVPFFGKSTGISPKDNLNNDSLMDNLQGMGSQHKSKEERAPLFKPEQNIHWANGAPNNTEFLLSRVNPGLRMANVKTWNEEQVGPGLN
jgi:hypothetical protein